MRALVTGGSGFVGYHVIQALLDHDWSVRALVRTEAARARLSALAVKPVYGDLQTGLGLEDAVKGVQAVFHVAALYSLLRRDVKAIYETNVGGTQRLLKVIQTAPQVERFIFTSSTASVGLRDDGVPADESLLVDPARVPDGYKRSKILSERLVLAAHAKGLDAVVVNPSAPVGSGDVKPTPTGQLIADAVWGKMPAYVETGLNWVAVEDVAEGHFLAWQRGQAGQRYILGHENLTLRQFLERLAHITGMPRPRFRVPWTVARLAAYADELFIAPALGRPVRAPIAGVELARRPMFYTPRRAVQELGLPQTPLDQALRQAVAWFQGREPYAGRSRRRE